jgi:hypothetical protein
VASKFGDQVKASNEKAKQRTLAVFRDSAQAVLNEANTPEGQGGKLPFDTGNLQNSVAASKEGMPSSESGDPSLVFAGMQLGETVFAGWTAVYALRQEHGYQKEDSLGRKYDQAGKGFMRSAAQRWDFIVAESIEKVKKEIP